MHELINGGSLMCTGGSQKCIDGPHSVKYSQMKQAQGITEQMKAENAWEWVGRMNNIQACAREIVDRELIYQ